MASQIVGGHFYVGMCSVRTVQNISCLLTLRPVPFADRLLLDTVLSILLPDE